MTGCDLSARKTAQGHTRRSPWRAMSMAIASAVVAGALVAASACGPDDPVQGASRDAAVIELVIRSVVLDGTEVDPDGDLPLIYVARMSEPIPIEAQAAVAAAVLDEAVVRFADDVVEAIDVELAREPVLEEGELLIFGEMPERGRTMTFVVTRYLDAKTTEDVEFTLLWSAPGWVIQRVETL